MVAILPDFGLLGGSAKSGAAFFVGPGTQIDDACLADQRGQGFYGQAGVTWVTGTAPHFLHLIPHWPCRGICEDRLADPAKVGRLVRPLQRHAAELPRRKSEWK